MEIPPLHLRGHLRAAGFADHEVRRLLRAGELVPVRRGSYVGRALPDDPVARHVLGLSAAVEHLGADVVLSHVSAAVLHGLPVWGIPLDRVHVTRDRRTGGRRGAALHLHAARLDHDEVVEIGGVRVTSLARTVVDLARTAPFEQAVATADAALRTGWLDRAGLDAAVARAVGWPGAPGARRAAAFADGLSESVGESRSRVAIALAGLPAPVPQWEVRTSGGRFVGRVDFGWPALRTVGEFDGVVKYGRLLRPGQAPGEVVFEEKLREDALRDQDLAVVRWTWADLGPAFAPTAARLRSRFRPR